MKDVIIKCEKGEVKKTLAYIEKKDRKVRWATREKPTGWGSLFERRGVCLIIENDVLTFIETDDFEYFDKKGKDVVSAEEFLGKNSKPSIVIFRRDRNVIAKDVATGNEGVAKCSPTDEFCFKTGASIALARLMAKTPEILTDDVKAEWKKVLRIEDIPARVDKLDESKIHEGDTVKVVNTGLNYSSYVQWVGEHISDPYMAARFCFGSPSTDKNYKCIKIAEHERNHRPLAYIEEIGGHAYNRCYLIEVKGLEKA